MSRSFEPERRILKLEQWPEQDRAAWQAMIRDDDILDDPGAAAHWSGPTREKRRKSYGRWLGFLAAHGWLDGPMSPAERVTPDRLRAYVDHLSAVCLPSSCAAFTLELYLVLRCLDPKADLEILHGVMRRLQSRMRRSGSRRGDIPSARALLELGMSEMEGWGRVIDGGDPPEPVRSGPLFAACRYRVGLTLAVLVACPLRLRTMAGLELDRHVVRLGDGYVIRLEPEDMKTGQPMTMPLAETLIPFMDRYLDELRPRLLREPTRRLWIDRGGGPLAPHTLSVELADLTERRLGVRVSCHRFRHAAATSLAREAPQHVYAIAGLLGHRSLETGERYYNLARQTEAAHDHQRLLDALRQRLQRLTDR